MTVTVPGAAPIGVSVNADGSVDVDVQTAVPNVAYTPFTPSIVGSSSDPTLDGSSFGYFQRLGRRVVGYTSCIFSSNGSGTFSFPLPVTPVNRRQPIGTGYLVDVTDSVAFYLTAVAVAPSVDASLRALFFMGGGAQLGAGANPVGSAVPFTWATSDSLTFNFDYEAAE